MVGKRCSRAFFGLVIALALGCGSKSDAGNGDGDTETEGETEDDSSGGAGDDNSNTSNQTVSGTSATSGETMDEGGFINPETGDAETGPIGPQPDGSMCASPDECDSGFCYIFPMLGGVCSECLVDQDCGEGTCSLDAGLGYAVCTDGSIGNMCNSDEGCMGDLVCAELVDTGGVFPANYCSECATDAECDNTDICTPLFDAAMFTGHMICATPGSVPDDQGCPLGSDGSVCEGGHCGTADLFGGFVELGICGDCTDDTDCTDGETCTAASAGQNGLMGPSCG